MAPEPAILKRQRSRPSEWWAAPLTSAPIDAIPPPRSVEEQKKARKKQMRGKIVGARISEAPAAGDKGVAKGKAGVKAKASRRGLSSGGDLGQSMLGLQAEGTLAKIKKGKEKGQGAPEKVKLLRSRSSSGEAELRGLGKCSQGVEAPVTHNRSKSTSGPVDQVIDELASTRGIKLTAARREERAGDDEREEATFARNRRGRATVSRSKDQTDGSLHQESGETAVAKNRGRKVIEQADELAEDEFEEPVVPRKRKRPTAAQSDNQVDELDKELEEVALRKNRRQPVVHVENEAGDVQPRVSKKRRRAALMETAVEPESGEPEPKKKHKRLSEAEILEQHSAHFAVVGSPVRGRTRHRASDIAAELSKVNAQETGKKRIHRPDNQPSNTSGVEPEDRGRRRTRSDAVVVKAVLESAKKLPGKFTKSNRQSEIIEVEAASSKLTNNRGDKQPKTTISSASVATVAGRAFSSTQASQKSKKAGQSSNRAITQKAVPALSQIRKKSPDRSTQVRRPSQKRRAANKSEPSKRQLIEEVRSQERSNEPEDELASYQHLKAVTRRISRQTIDAKWEPLQLNSVDCITQLLQDAQRPVLTRIHDEKKKTQASTALQSTSRNLIKKLKKGLPFPPGSRSHKEDDFDFEKVLDHSRALEAQLTPAMHSNSLLTAELSKEVALLESDKEKLAELEANARSEAAARSKAARKFHSVLQSDDPSSKVEALKDDIGLDITRQSRPLDLELHDDENLQALVKDLDGHVGTVQGNIQQIEGISQAIANSRAAVQASLFQRLDNAQYYEVVLGTED
ncbi:hypothetical protein PZA11_004147 [Diplocarpon coronariae]|nr:hypothetical protein JHW43_003278 [Diplocarpon mali]